LDFFAQKPVQISAVRISVSPILAEFQLNIAENWPKIGRKLAESNFAWNGLILPKSIKNRPGIGKKFDQILLFELLCRISSVDSSLLFFECKISLQYRISYCFAVNL
jgi:hypothetical protein